MEELLRHHRAVLLEHHAVLHYELHVAQGVDVGERVAGDGDMSAKNVAVIGALALYLDLRLFGDRRR